MKAYAWASPCALILLLAPASAQDAQDKKDKEPPGRSVAADEFPAGGWKTSDPMPEAVISTGLPASVPLFIYSIYNPVLVDGTNLSYTIVRDGQTVVPASGEGNAALIEGRNLSIRQTTPGIGMAGVWRASRFPGTAPLDRQVQWGAFPGRETIVASFDKSRLLLVTLYESNDCTDETMQVKIDDVPLKYGSGSVIRWPGNGSVLTYGKKVSLAIGGSCAAGVTAIGQLRYSEPM